MALSQKEKGEAFRALHEGETFVIPNPWDVGTAKVLAGLGFKALTTTSGGLAFVQIPEALSLLLLARRHPGFLSGGARGAGGR